MPTRSAQAKWQGGLKNGKGEMSLGSGAFSGPYSFSTRFEDAQGTNPEELIGAAHAGCFAMAFSKGLGDAGFEPESIEAKAEVHLDKTDQGFAISRIELQARARVPNIDQSQFQQLAEGAKANCPVSKALAGVNIELKAELVS